VSVTVPPPFYSYQHAYPWLLHSFPTRRSSDLHDQGSSRAPRRPSASRLEGEAVPVRRWVVRLTERGDRVVHGSGAGEGPQERVRSEEHTSELQSRENLVCRLLLEKKKKKNHRN